MYIAHSHVLLDACCVLNFCASGKLLAILKSIPAQVAVTQVVQERELRTLQGLKDEENEGAIQFETAIAQSLLTVVDFESEEEVESFVNYAAILKDDGESATCAIAIHRGWAIATDDKRAIAFFQQTAPYLQVLSTPDIIKHWSEESPSMTEAEALQKAQELWKSKWRVYEIHRYLLDYLLERSLVDRVVLEVTGVDFCGGNPHSY